MQLSCNVLLIYNYNWSFRLNILPLYNFGWSGFVPDFFICQIQEVIMETIAEKELPMWEEYARNPNRENREKIILYYMELVKIVVASLWKYFYSVVEFDDLLGYGVLGLIDAIYRFDHTRGIKFSTYAYTRIKGSILDNMRDTNWIPRSVTDKIKKLRKLGIEIEKPNILFLEEILEKEIIVAQNGMPEEYIIKTARIPLLKDAIEKLNPREQKIIKSHYFRYKKFKKIAKEIEISETYASTIHQNALKKLARILKKDKGLFLN